ncbi:glycoside hydrolase family 16 protein [Cytobacillus depressus]|uniref:Glycoside hydrolase family 16 protein n=1 Tax=Cytobacillus depressus TaxID=1602942 RepID=A0A6L3V656_9BACI|nr:glycoside hydrolase family 16 protein [Cytobacillus depressus]KAB2336726.1 glycoside hydrolase family 16 protein [Cytobacillus depressus]
MKKFLFGIIVIAVILFVMYLVMFKNQHETEKGFSLLTEDTNMENINSTLLEEQANKTQDGWYLVWEDNFDGKRLDLKKWNIEEWAAVKNNELQYYGSKNVDVEKGYLKIISKKENKGGRKYTSGAIHSKDKFSFLYGKVEMRAKLPGGQGIFPAFWMMTNKDHIWLPEIDIMEMLGQKPDEIWMVMHRLGEDKKLKSVSSVYKGIDYTKDFHVFGIEWTPNNITWFIDGIERFKIDQFIPQEEMYLYLNTAVGGNWPGSPDHTTPFPAIFQVDYVRVYQKTEE